ncbi:hypothetical protein ADUPG1_007084, partial [Aduncisulcus paluster]
RTTTFVDSKRGNSSTSATSDPSSPSSGSSASFFAGLGSFLFSSFSDLADNGRRELENVCVRVGEVVVGEGIGMDAISDIEDQLVNPSLHIQGTDEDHLTRDPESLIPVDHVDMGGNTATLIGNPDSGTYNLAVSGDYAVSGPSRKRGDSVFSVQDGCILTVTLNEVFSSFVELLRQILIHVLPFMLECLSISLTVECCHLWIQREKDARKKDQDNQFVRSMRKSEPGWMLSIVEEKEKEREVKRREFIDELLKEKAAELESGKGKDGKNAGKGKSGKSSGPGNGKGNSGDSKDKGKGGKKKDSSVPESILDSLPKTSPFSLLLSSLSVEDKSAHTFSSLDLSQCMDILSSIEGVLQHSMENLYIRGKNKNDSTSVGQDVKKERMRRREEEEEEDEDKCKVIVDNAIVDVNSILDEIEALVTAKVNSLFGDMQEHQEEGGGSIISFSEKQELEDQHSTDFQIQAEGEEEEPGYNLDFSIENLQSYSSRSALSIPSGFSFIQGLLSSLSSPFISLLSSVSSDTSTHLTTLTDMTSETFTTLDSIVVKAFTQTI